ncbi:hypothetical protein C0995_002901, partial [Termitomyces sp. Mi166
MPSNSNHGRDPNPSQVSGEPVTPASLYSNAPSSKPVTPPPKDNGPKIGSTPIKNHRAKSNDLNAIPENHVSRVENLHAEILERVVGPVDVEAFNGFFRPLEQASEPQPDGKAAYQELSTQLAQVTSEEG